MSRRLPSSASASGIGLNFLALVGVLEKDGEKVWATKRKSRYRKALRHIAEGFSRGGYSSVVLMLILHFLSGKIYQILPFVIPRRGRLLMRTILVPQSPLWHLTLAAS